MSNSSDEDIIKTSIEYGDTNEIKLYKTYFIDLLGGNINTYLKKIN